MPAFLKTLDARWMPKDPLFRLFVINGLAGLLIAILVLGGIFYANIGNLTVLVKGDESPVVPVLMLAGGLIITLGSVVIGSAVMLLSGDPAGGKPKGGKPARLLPLSVPTPALVPARAPARRR